MSRVSKITEYNLKNSKGPLMKKHRFYGGLFVPVITTRCSYLTNNIKNTTNYSPPPEQANHAQAELLAIQTILNEKYKTNIIGLLSLLQLWNNHRPDRKIIRLEGYKNKE